MHLAEIWRYPVKSLGGERLDATDVMADGIPGDRSVHVVDGDGEVLTGRRSRRLVTVWYSSVKIDKGSSDGVREDQPVIAAGGLAGKVTRVTGGTAEVTLITDAESAVSAQIMPEGANGIVKPEVGNPNDLLLDFVEKGRRVTEGTTVVTSGFTSSRVESLFPRGIPIGRVRKVDLDEIELYQRVHVDPFADLRRLDVVQVLTKKPPAAQASAFPPAEVPAP